MQAESSLLNVQQAAARLNMSRAALDTLRSRGGGPRYVKLGKRVFYDPTDIDRWIDAHKVTPGRAS